MTCLDCADEVDHCHGTLVVRVDGVLECTDHGCVALVRERHELVVVAPGVSGTSQGAPSDGGGEAR
jgi:hypothetical protein